MMNIVSNLARFEIQILFACILMSCPGVAHAKLMPSYDMASMYYKADNVVQVDEIIYVQTNAMLTVRCRIREVHKGSLKLGQTITVSMGRIFLRPDEEPAAALMFLGRPNEQDEYSPIASGIKIILQNNNVLEYEQRSNPGPYRLVSQKPEFIMLKQGETYTISSLKDDLVMAIARAKRFQDAYESGNVKTLQQYLPKLERQKRSFDQNELSHRAADKLIEVADKATLQKILEKYNDKCDPFVIRRLSQTRETLPHE